MRSNGANVAISGGHDCLPNRERRMVRNYHTEARHVLLQCFQPLKGVIASHNHSKVLHELRDVAGLSTARRTHRGPFLRLWIQNLAREQGTRS